MWIVGADLALKYSSLIFEHCLKKIFIKLNYEFYNYLKIGCIENLYRYSDKISFIINIKVYFI